MKIKVSHLPELPVEGRLFIDSENSNEKGREQYA